MKKFKIIKKERVLDEEYCRVEKQIVELPNESKADWWVMIKPEVVAVVPITKAGKVLLQRNYKHGAGQIITEVVAGVVDDGEDFKEAAKRELAEETGYTAPKMVKIGEIYANPTSTSMKYHVFLALECEKTQEVSLDDAEQIEPFEVEDVKAAIEICQKEKTSSTTLSALLLAGEYLKN